jgi:hypothetical protein
MKLWLIVSAAFGYYLWSQKSATNFLTSAGPGHAMGTVAVPSAPNPPSAGNTTTMVPQILDPIAPVQNVPISSAGNRVPPGLAATKYTPSSYIPQSAGNRFMGTAVIAENAVY